MKLISDAFENGGEIPKVYTCDGDDVNPPLVIEDVPNDARSLVLVVDDHDAPMGVWDHWIVYNISADAGEIPANSVPPGSIEAKNSMG